MNTRNAVDVVITWVDGLDESWAEERDHWLRSDCRPTYSNNISSAVRFRDWGTLPFLFRGIERFAPWVNRVFFVTWGHIPTWLNTNNEKLVIVKHKDYMPERYLPTFSSPAIEFCFNRISGLSERFIYFNDDMFLLKDVYPEDFFVKGRPVLTPMESAITLRKSDLFFTQMVNAAVINGHFDKRKTQISDFGKWLSPRIPLKSRLSNILMGVYPTFKAFEDTHMPSPYLKSTLDNLWRAEYSMLDYVCSEKFRAIDGANLWLAKCWQIASGEYEVGRPLGRLYPRRNKSFDDETCSIYECIVNQTEKAICIGDSECSDIDFEVRRELVCEAFRAILPSPSTFELSSFAFSSTSV